ncbi:DUF3040 domain-containing protein [Actinokineospora sp. G85]|uniref:DUF3040 domain-containing protein n=1 Tax=Actinokineospora sp. G85 TaxID=3406626 RepID=UPI003C7493A8
MPLSEHEQRLLDQIERALYAEDPKFASTVRGARLRKPSRRRRLLGIALFIVGAALLVVGVAFNFNGFPALSLLGFLAMFGGVMVTLTAMRRGGEPAEPGQESESGGGRATSARNRSSFSQRMEERFKRRFDEER